MSTIRHPVQTHAWWYAAAAAVLLAGLLAVLMATVFTTSSGTVGNTDVGTRLVGYHGHAYAPPCFMGRPGDPIELARSGCRA